MAIVKLELDREAALREVVRIQNFLKRSPANVKEALRETGGLEQRIKNAPAIAEPPPVEEPPVEEPPVEPPPPTLGVPPWGTKKTSWDATVSTASAIQAEAGKSANAGKVIAIRGGTYGRLSLSGGSSAPFGPSTGLVTFIAYPGETVTITGITYRFSRNIRFEGVKFAGTVEMQEGSVSTPNQNLEFYGCEFSGYTGNGITMWVNSKNVLAEGCYFHDLSYGSVTGGDQGYGIRCSGGGSQNSNLVVRGCKFDHLSDDNLQISSTKGVLIDRCELSNWNRHQDGRSGPTTDAHADGIQVFGGQEVTMSNCYVHGDGTEQGIFFEGYYSGAHIDNCFITGAATYGLVMQDGSGIGSGTSSANVVVENCTIVGNHPDLQKNHDHSAGSVLRNNLIGQMSMVNGATWGTNTGNQIGGSPVFNAAHEATNYTQGYRKPSGVWF